MYNKVEKQFQEFKKALFKAARAKEISKEN